MKNIVIEYDYYTLDQAREIIREEEKQKAIRRAKRKAKRKAKRIYYIKQKFLGLAAVGISALELLAGYNGLIDEGGAFIFLLPIGIYALFTNEKMI